ncbi:hypothetical protein [Stutzerimonas nitrititolerans]|uniref:hypothetical protein n=1 Tax=Stutzerimonas nitrititolerans TaxID=2482751 RepID=UPI00289B8B0E|nr:hypothetical protein [Stutzerimonas nitrititolerans]
MKKYPSVEELIRKHSKARVVTPTRISVHAERALGIRQIADRDVIDSMVRKYA